jgi:hypothetical protein
MIALAPPAVNQAVQLHRTFGARDAASGSLFHEAGGGQRAGDDGTDVDRPVARLT